MNNQLTIPGANDNSIKHQITIALTDTKISTAKLSDLAEAISSSLEQAIFYLGLNKNETDRGLLKVAVIEDCRNQFPSLTLAEIQLAIKRGVRGEYGEVFGVSPKDVFSWLTAFKRDAIRLAALKELEAENEKDQFQRIPSEQELIDLAMFNLNEAWYLFKTKGNITRNGAELYNILEANNILKPSKEEKTQLLLDAKSSLLKYHDHTKHLGNDIKMQEALKLSASIRESDSNIRITNEAKQIAVNRFFKELVEKNIDLWSLFK